jgi:hypothetical protein
MDWGYIIAQDDRATDDYVRSYPNESKRTVQDYYLLADPLAQLNAKRFDQFLYIFAVHRARDNAHLPLAEQPGYKSPDTNEMLPVSYRPPARTTATNGTLRGQGLTSPLG